MNFAMLDDLLPEVDAIDPVELEALILGGAVAQIGPLVEYAYVQQYSIRTLPKLPTASTSSAVRALHSTRRSVSLRNTTVDTTPEARQVEFCWTPPAGLLFQSPTWTSFRMRLQNAAERAGFSKRTAQRFTGAVDEMVSNVVEHSQRPTTGMAGYRWTNGEFEYVIADAGEGVLRSLRRHPDYRQLDDAGAALKVALSDGESRFGRQSGRGAGFRQIFLSLSNLGARLRFRSEAFRLEIEDHSPMLAAARISTAAHYCGLLVSVNCRL